AFINSNISTIGSSGNIPGRGRKFLHFMRIMYPSAIGWKLRMENNFCFDTILYFAGEGTQVLFKLFRAAVRGAYITLVIQAKANNHQVCGLIPEAVIKPGDSLGSTISRNRNIGRLYLRFLVNGT